MDSIMKDSLLKAEKAHPGLEFENDTLSLASLKAFEVRASQKLKDVYDYAQIILDPSIEKSFKNQAKQMMLALFDNEGTTIEITLNENEKPQAIPIKNFINNLLNTNSPKPIFDIKDIKPSKEIRKYNKDNAYRGQLTFLQTIYRTDNSKPVIIQFGKMTASYFIIRVKKEFGASTKEVWEVLLGNINVAQEE